MVLLNRQRQSRMETNRRGFNFLITSRGYHRYSILHKRKWLLGSLYLHLSLSLCLAYSETVLLLLVFLFCFLSTQLLLFLLIVPFFPHSPVLFCSALYQGGRLEERIQLPYSPLLFSLLCCHRNKEWRYMLCVFFFAHTESNDGEKDEIKM